MKRAIIEAVAIVVVIVGFVFAAAASTSAQDNCTTTCQWIGDQWVCNTWCY